MDFESISEKPPVYNDRGEAGIEELLRQKKILEEQLREIDNKINILQSKDSGGSFIKDENKPESREVKYFSGKIDKILEGELSNSSGAKFKIFNIDGNRAEFEFCGSVINENWFDGVADIMNDVSETLNNKNNIITTKPGIVVKEGGNWRVEKRVEIKFL